LVICHWKVVVLLIAFKIWWLLRRNFRQLALSVSATAPISKIQEDLLGRNGGLIPKNGTRGDKKNEKLTKY
jgi:hypothetical protein